MSDTKKSAAPTKKSPENLGWNFIDGNVAEKTAAFGGNPLKTHRMYGNDEDQLLANIADFEARLDAANGPAEEPAAADEAEAAEEAEEGEDG